MFFSLVRRARVVAKFVETSRLVGDAEYKKNVIQYLSEGGAFNLKGSVGTPVSPIKKVDLPVDASTASALSAEHNRAA